MMRAFLFWLTGRLPCRIISDGESPYLERYYLATLFGWRFYLHRFVASDPDRGLHDHPWPRAFSIILSGYYWEETRSGFRSIHWFNSLTGDTFHRVILPRDWLAEMAARAGWGGAITSGTVPEACWTLFFHRTGHSKPWGFWRELSHGAIFEPYLYAKEGDQRRWWERAPKGRDEPRRMPQ